MAQLGSYGSILSSKARAAAYKEYEFDDNDSLDGDDGPASDEDTEDASETDMIKKEEEFTEIKEQMYQDKLAQLKKQLQQLKEGTLPEYLKRLKKIDQQYKERLRVNEIWHQYEMESAEREYHNEQRYSIQEFEERVIDLKENLIYELEEKKRNIDTEKLGMEMTGDSMELKPVTTRKLRRRPNDPMPMPEKRRKASPAQLNYMLDEDEIMEDIKIIQKISGKPLNKKPTGNASSNPTPENAFDARIEDGRLHYDKKWFLRGQPVIVESKDMGKVPGVISAVGAQEIWVRRSSDNGKLRVYVAQLQKGRFILKKKTT
ncbi:sin3 histone deacetylase corepressor complex component SDS3-like [Tubulanus polymorphus]|uniref:sin3 histone deacetylase corepressor complex component SDS3-like n=1 Tax=Tubulanus polymorphus TaxID=672921 RepID=UPI003DA3AD88